MSHPKTSWRAELRQSVRPEDRALLGSNPSAAADSNTAGLDDFGRPGRPPAGSTTKRKIPGGLGDSVPQEPSCKPTNKIGLVSLLNPALRTFPLTRYTT